MGFDLNFQVVKVDGKTPVDISNATVTFKMVPEGGSASKINAPCVITDGPNGRCKYTVRADDLDIVGAFEAELRVAFTPSKILTAELETIHVERELPE
jgi:hypothetical protein